MTDIYDVAIKIVSKKEHCAQEHKVGDELIIKACIPLPPWL